MRNSVCISQKHITISTLISNKILSSPNKEKINRNQILSFLRHQIVLLKEPALQKILTLPNNLTLKKYHQFLFCRLKIKLVWNAQRFHLAIKWDNTKLANVFYVAHAYWAHCTITSILIVSQSMVKSFVPFVCKLQMHS